MSKLRAFTMPKWGIEMTTGSISEWMVDEGDAFSKGDVLLAIETDKIVNEVEADYDAVCLRKVASLNTDYPVGALLAVFGETATSSAEVDEFIASFKAADGYDNQDAESADSVESSEKGSEQATQNLASPTVAEQPATPKVKPAHKTTKPVRPAIQIPSDLAISEAAREFAIHNRVDVSAIAGAGQKGRILLQDVEQAKRGAGPYQGSGKAIQNAVVNVDAESELATPVARRLALENSIDLATIEGSGKGGRIRRRDLNLSNEKALASGEEVTTPFSRMRGHIAERLTRSHSEIPHYYLQTQVNVDALMTQRDEYNRSSDHHATINDVIMLATARALRANPRVNIHVVDESIKAFGDVNVAIAVAIEDGLITPVVQRADQRSLVDLSREAKRLIEGARAGTLRLPEYAKGTFTVSNLGMHGINEFTSIINPPQAAILSVGMFRRVPFEGAAGVEFGWQVSLTLACDHRAIDGTIGTRMLATLKNLLESPNRLFI